MKTFSEYLLEYYADVEERYIRQQQTSLKLEWLEHCVTELAGELAGELAARQPAPPAPVEEREMAVGQGTVTLRVCKCGNFEPDFEGDTFVCIHCGGLRF